MSAITQATEFGKKHWQVIAGALVGILVLYYLYKTLSGASTSTPGSSTDISGGANSVQALSAAADLTNAQTNAGVEVASYSAQVADNQTQAQLQATLAQTAAQLDATNKQTQAAEVVDLGSQSTAVSLQSIQSGAQVEQTQIEGATLDTLARTAGQTAVQVQQAKNQVALAQLSDVASQVTQIQDNSKHASQDYAAFAPILALETGQGTAAAGIAAANSKTAVASSQATASVASSVSSGIGSLLSGLFA